MGGHCKGEEQIWGDWEMSGNGTQDMKLPDNQYKIMIIKIIVILKRALKKQTGRDGDTFCCCFAF